MHHVAVVIYNRKAMRKMFVYVMPILIMHKDYSLLLL